MREGWEIKKLGEVCRFINGRAYSKNELLDTGKYPVLRVGNFFTNRQWYYSDLELEEDKYCDNGDLLYAWSASFGPRIWEGEKVIYHYHIWKVVPDSTVVSKQFLFQLLEWDTENLKKAHGTGTTMMHVGKASIEARLVPIPPLPDQQRIVSILGEAFAAIDNAKANVHKNLSHAKELFQSELNTTFSQKGEGWVEKSLGDVCETRPQKREARETLGDDDLVTFLPMEDLGIEAKHIMPQRERKLKEVAGSYTYFANGDVLLAKITPCFENGKIGIAADLRNGIGFGSSEYMVFRTKGAIDRELLYYFLSRKSFRDEGARRMTGAVGHKRVAKDWIENYPIQFPASFEEQQRIVGKLSSLEAHSKKLEVLYERKLTELNALKKSILHQAFSGQLTKPAFVDEAA